MVVTIRYICVIISILVIVVYSGCSDRVETPVTTDDNTIIYPSVRDDGINARITFFRKTSKKTGKLIGKETVFTIKDKRNLRASIDIENIIANNKRELVFHIDWINDDGKSFHRKQVDLLSDDTLATLMSSISISPNVRSSGNYILKLYLHRELIAEKYFTLLPEEIIMPLVGDSISANIILYRKKSKKTGKLIGKGTVFKIKKNRNVRALININNRFGYGDRELKFQIKWIDKKGETIYRKRINLPSTDSTSTISSSISYGNRLPGNYKLQVFLFDKLIGEKKFKIRL